MGKSDRITEEVRFKYRCMTVILVIVLIGCSTFLWVYETGKNGSSMPLYLVAIHCTKISNNYDCTFINADSGTIFSNINIDIKNWSGTIVSHWGNPIEFVNSRRENQTANYPILKGEIIDNGDNVFGLQDWIHIVPYSNESLFGFKINIYGDNHIQGQETIP